MAISLLSLFLSYSLCWYGAFHLSTSPPTENVLIYYLSFFHLILSFAYLFFIHPFNILMGSQLKNQSFDNALNKKPRLTKSGSFPAAKLDHKQQGKESAQSMPLYFRKEIKRTLFRRRGLSLSDLDYNSAELDLNTDDSSSVSTAISEEYEMCSIKFFISEEKSDLDNPEDEEFDPEFHYIKHVLELSGFTNREKNCKWYSIEQPINPHLFEEIERQYSDLDPQQSSNEIEESRRVRQLIFDLINEALVHIYDKQYLYYPIPEGRYLVDEVWELVTRSLNWRPNLDALLLAYDLNPHDVWMNLQIEREWAALEVQDFILDELLDDLILDC